MYNFFVAQMFGILGIICSVLSMQFKKRKNILYFLLGLNLASALNFLFLDNLAGSYISFFAIFEMLINYIFESKNKRVPYVIVSIYIIINIVLGIISFNSIFDVLPIICSIIFCITILCKKEYNIRKLTILNQVFWLIFDIYTKSYMFCICNILTMISSFIALKRYNEL